MSCGGGFVAPGFEVVAEEFRRSFTERGEVGAAFAAVHHQELVVDLWGGVADRQAARPWTADTLQLIFSGTKGLVAVCLLILLDRGQVALDERVCTYWPDFADGDKNQVRVSDIVAHTARLPGLTTPVGIADLTDDRLMAGMLARQPQIRDLRARSTYHALTFGWLCGELIRRIDGRSVGRFFADEVATPLDLDLYIGLPAQLESRISRLELSSGWGTGTHYSTSATERDQLAWAVWANPSVFMPNAFPWNDRAFHQAEIPAVNGIGTARAIATMYGNLDRLVRPDVLARATTQLESRREPLLDVQQRFSIAFALQTDEKPFGPPEVAFGHPGAGGSVHGYWPEHGVGFSYAMNLMRDDQVPDPRPQALLNALHTALPQSMDQPRVPDSASPGWPPTAQRSSHSSRNEEVGDRWN